MGTQTVERMGQMLVRVTPRSEQHLDIDNHTAADLSDNKKAVNLRRESAILLLRLVWRCSAKCANCLSG